MPKKNKRVACGLRTEATISYRGSGWIKRKISKKTNMDKKVSLTEDTYCYDCWIVATKPVKKGSAPQQFMECWPRSI